jgi:hypothetical protein
MKSEKSMKELFEIAGIKNIEEAEQLFEEIGELSGFSKVGWIAIPHEPHLYNQIIFDQASYKHWKLSGSFAFAIAYMLDEDIQNSHIKNIKTVQVTKKPEQLEAIGQYSEAVGELVRLKNDNYKVFVDKKYVSDIKRNQFIKNPD